VGGAPPGGGRVWKAIATRPALGWAVLDGEGEEGASVGAGEAGIPYDWEIVMR
jgi:hypothetical protein